jgi:hypothetical protein
MRKPRHQKFFNDKFAISHDSIKGIEKEILIKLDNFLLGINKKRDYISHKNIIDLLSKIDFYLGVFYIAPNDVNHLLNLNMENIYQDVVKLSDVSHNENDWAYNNDDFQKVFVLANDGQQAVIGAIYNEFPGNIFITNTISTCFLCLEGNMLFHINDNHFQPSIDVLV